MDWRGQVVLVTGGGRGIGLEIARGLRARGARVLIVGRDAARTDAAAAELGLTALACDLSDRTAVDGLVARVRAEHPDLTGVILNAAVQHELDLIHGDPAGTTRKAREEIAVDLDACVALTAGLLPILAGRGGGTLCFVNSGLALAPKEASPVYCAAKAGLRAFAAATRHQCARHAPGLGVHDAILPMVDTDMTRGRGRAKMAARDAAEAILRGIEAGRPVIWVGAARLLRVLDRVAPSVPRRLLRGDGHPGAAR